MLCIQCITLRLCLGVDKGICVWNPMLKRLAPKSALSCSYAFIPVVPLTPPLSVLLLGLAPASTSGLSCSDCPALSCSDSNPRFDVSWWTAGSSLIGYQWAHDLLCTMWIMWFHPFIHNEMTKGIFSRWRNWNSENEVLFPILTQLTSAGINQI